MKGYYEFEEFRLYYDTAEKNGSNKASKFGAPRLERNGVLVRIDDAARQYLFQLMTEKPLGMENSKVGTGDIFGVPYLFKMFPTGRYLLGRQVMEALGQSSFDGPYLSGFLDSGGFWCWFFVAKKKHVLENGTSTSARPKPASQASQSKTPKANPEAKMFEYDVCLSFAGEDREIAEALAALLVGRKISVFYDIYEKADLWGKDLYQHLASIYSKKSRYCIILVSRHYKEKLWTKHELRNAQERAFSENQEYILPVRIDDTELPGIQKTMGYLDLRVDTVESIVKLLEKKLKKNPGRGPR